MGMDWKSWLEWIACIVFLAGYVPIIKNTIHGPLRPPKVSWLVFFLNDTVSGICQYMGPHHAVTGQLIGATLGAAAVCIVTLKYGKKGWSRADIITLIGAGIAMGAAIIYRNSWLGVLLSQAASWCGCGKLFQHAIAHSEEESRTAWFLFWVSVFPQTGALLLGEITAEEVIQIVSFFIGNTIMVYLLFFYPRGVQRKKINFPGSISGMK